jgi:hypothetical protein
VGQVAQLVEQGTENPCVTGSIPVLPTMTQEEILQEGKEFFETLINVEDKTSPQFKKVLEALAKELKQ